MSVSSALDVASAKGDSQERMRFRSVGRIFLRVALGFIIVSVFIQILIAPSISNISSVFICAVISSMTFLYLFGTPNAASRHPLSSLALLGLNVSSLSGALFYQSLSFTPLVSNLVDPVRTFTCLALFQATLVLAHLIYSGFPYLAEAAPCLSGAVVRRLGLFRMPRRSQLWLLGVVGMIAIWFSAVSVVAYGDVGGKALSGLAPFAYAPFIIPFLDRRHANTSKGQAWLLLSYGLVLVAVAMVRNARAVFSIALISLVLISYLMYISGSIRVTRRSVAIACASVVLAVLCFGLLTDLATAMVVVRSQRDQVKGVALIKLTVNALGDRKALRLYRESANSALPSYNEVYISNPVFARLITTKFDDNMLHYESLLVGPKRDEVWDITDQKVIAILPTTLIKAFGGQIDKTKLQFSMGDFIYSRVSGVGLGGYRTGSITAHGLILFGPWFYLIVLVLAPLAFIILDSFTDTNFHRAGLQFAPFILIFVYDLWSLFYGDSCLNVVGFFLRDLPQSVVLYLVISRIVSWIAPSHELETEPESA